MYSIANDDGFAQNSVFAKTNRNHFISNMWFDWNILAFVVIPLQFVVFIKGSPASNAGVRERRFLGWIGYLSGW